MLRESRKEVKEVRKQQHAPAGTARSRAPCGDRGTQRGYSSKPLKHSIVKRILVLKR